MRLLVQALCTYHHNAEELRRTGHSLEQNPPQHPDHVVIEVTGLIPPRPVQQGMPLDTSRRRPTPVEYAL